MPMHWTAAFAPSGRANPLVAASLDPRSGQPEFKHTPARVRPYRETWRGFFMAREAWATPPGLDLIWRRIPQAGCQLHEFAGRGDVQEREALGRVLTRGAAADVLRFEDASAGSVREAHLLGEALDRVLFTTVGGTLPPRDWLVELFAAEALSAQERTALLIGRAPGRLVEAGPLVCACLGVRADRIAAAARAGARTLDAVADVTGAGTNCGSCRPEIARLVREAETLEIRDAA